MSSQFLPLATGCEQRYSTLLPSSSQMIGCFREHHICTGLVVVLGCCFGEHSNLFEFTKRHGKGTGSVRVELPTRNAMLPQLLVIAEGTRETLGIRQQLGVEARYHIAL